MNEIKENIKQLLDSTYELEGLLYLCLERDDARSKLLSLIKEKAEELTQSCAQLPEPKEESRIQTPTYVIPDTVYAEQDSKPEIPEPSGNPVNYSAGSGSLPQFSINDRFLFIRTLFEGDKAKFEEKIREAAALDSYDEAERYFREEVGLDPDSEQGERFIAVFRTYFDGRK